MVTAEVLEKWPTAVAMALWPGVPVIARDHAALAS
jgi:hypothetical protein